MQKLLTFGLCLYCLAYAFEGAFRYGLNLLQMDGLIFVRDLILLIPVALLGVRQFLSRNLHPAYLIFSGIVLLHGLVFFLNFLFIPPVIFGTKVIATILAGAIGSQILMQPGRRLVVFFSFLWFASVTGVALDKLGVFSFPWVGLSTMIGDVQVDISRNWTVEQASADYRAGGFMRSSIHAANLIPLLALLLLFHLRSLPTRLVIGGSTLLALYWTTQKGSLLAFGIVVLLMLIPRPFAVMSMRVCFVFFLLMMIGMPLGLPGYHMPEASAGGFSNMSFNLRVEMMWPDAWHWIGNNEVFPFGVGLGGIGGGQQLFAINDINAADNLFVFMYAYFGVMSLFYLGLSSWTYLRTPANNASERQALSVLLFIVIYGCVLSMLEDQMTALFTGAALGWICYGRKRILNEQHGQPAISYPVVRQQDRNNPLITEKLPSLDQK